VCRRVHAEPRKSAHTVDVRVNTSGLVLDFKAICQRAPSRRPIFGCSGSCPGIGLHCPAERRRERRPQCLANRNRIKYLGIESRLETWAYTISHLDNIASSLPHLELAWRIVLTLRLERPNRVREVFGGDGSLP
jgi:hypothetical protein